MTIKKTILFFLFISIQVTAQDKKWTLKECVEYALENNISIKSSELDLQNATVNKKDAIGAFLPNINASASHSWNIGLNQNITTGLLQNQTTQFTSAGLNVGVDIYNGLRNQLQLRKSNLSIIATQYQLTKMKDDMSLNVANAFLQILFNKENLKVQKQQKEFNLTQLSRTEDLVEAGVVPRGDLLDIKATVASDYQRVIAAENALLISKLSLAQLLRLDDFKNFDIDESQIPGLSESILLETSESIAEKAKETRIELKIAQSSVELAEKDISIAKAAYQPTLSGFYSFNTRAAYSDRIVGFQPNAANPTSVIGFVDGTNQQVLQPNFSPILGGPQNLMDQFSNNKGQNFGVQLSVPIFNGFAVRNNVERSKIALDRAKINLEQQELDMERNVYTAYTDANAAKESFEAAKTTLEARTLSHNYAKERYEVGLMNVFDFNQAQTLLVNAQSEVLRTKYDYLFRIKILEFYFGIPLIEK
ncbi:TolC family protein [Flavobacterium sp.]|uniref:TolC family protein n=1 Tax=Flavobacterium sp. TaxID=239 RepID=UPI003F6A32C2